MQLVLANFLSGRPLAVAECLGAWGEQALPHTILVRQASLRGRDSGRPRFDPNRVPQSSGEGLEADLDDMVQDLSPVQNQMQIALGSAGECFEKHWGKFDVPSSQLGSPWQRHFPNEVRPAGQIERARGARFVHGQGGPAVANEACLVAEGFGDRLSDDEADVFGCMMAVDLNVARRTHRKVDEAMASDLIDHMAQKRQRGVDLRTAGSVQIQRDLDGRFFRFSGDRR